jgi:hypothetical protein
MDIAQIEDATRRGVMINPRSFLSTLLLSFALFASPAFAKEKQCRLTLLFSKPDFKWSRVITFRDDFHLFLDANPFPTVKDIIFVAGTVYPKDGSDHVSLAIGTSLINKESGQTLGQAKHLKLPKNGEFKIPPMGGHYKACKARIEFVQ